MKKRRGSDKKSDDGMDDDGWLKAFLLFFLVVCAMSHTPVQTPTQYAPGDATLIARSQEEK